MIPSDQTPRQYMMELLIGAYRSSYELAGWLGIPERLVEDHLRHIAKSVARDRIRHFVVDPSMCQECRFVFRERTRLTRASRCPRCRSESISSPRFMIELRPSK